MALSNLNLANVVKVAGGYGHSLAITAAGELYAWGLNADSQLGDGTTENRLTPTRIGTATDWVDIACGDYHSLGLKSNGDAYAWGSNAFYQCGGTTLATKSTPTLSGSGYKSVAAASNYSLFLSTAGALSGLGASNNNEITSILGDRKSIITSIASGIDFVTAGPTLWCGFRGNDLFIRGLADFGNTNDGSNFAYNLLGTAGAVIPGSTGKPFVSIGIGGEFLLAIGADGKLYGYTFKDYTGTSSPTPAEANTAIGSYGVVIISVSGTWWPQFNTLAIIDDTKHWLRVACGTDHALLTDVDNNVYSIGSNQFGQLGRTYTGNDFNIVPLESPANTGSWPVIGCGAYHSLLCLGS